MRITDIKPFYAGNSQFRERGYDVSLVMNRQFYHSLYDRDQGGIHFGLATDGREIAAKPTEWLMVNLPDWLEENREMVEGQFPRFRGPTPDARRRSRGNRGRDSRILGMSSSVEGALVPNDRMNQFSRVSDWMAAQSVRGILQLGVAALGGLIILGSLGLFALVFVAMGRSEDGFAEGLAILVFGGYMVVGFVVLSAGLLLQPRGGGIQFSRRQRRLLIYGAIAPVISVILIPAGAVLVPPLSPIVHTVLVAGLAGLILSGPVATIVAIVFNIRNHRGS